MGVEEGKVEGAQMYKDLSPTNRQITRAEEIEDVFNSLGREVSLSFKPRNGDMSIRLHPTNLPPSSTGRKKNK